MARRYPGLRTHDFTKWIPPKGHFVRYDVTDREWMEPLGIGSYEQDDLFDVRDRLNVVVGYTRQDPSKCDRGFISFAVRDYEPMFRTWPPKYPAGPLQIRQIRVDVTRWVNDRGRSFSCWECRPDDAIDLIQSNFIECVAQSPKYREVSAYRERLSREQPFEFRFRVTESEIPSVGIPFRLINSMSY